MNEACPLKVREYLACGLPCIIGYKDADFPEHVDFLLQIPSRRTGAKESMQKIREFVAAWRSKRVPRERIAHLDLEAKERLRLQFFQQILRCWNGENQ